MEFWEEMLDEYALHPEPITWFNVPATALGMLIGEQFEAVHTLVEKGYLAWAGVSCEQWKESLYRITPAGLEYWEKNIKGQRKRPLKAPPVPRWTTSQIAAATSPTSVWDLARVPITWVKEK